MRIPDDVLKCVAFIGHTVDGSQRYEGTGFFVTLPLETMVDQGVTYLVTAKHVAEKVAGNFWVRINRADGGVAYIESTRDWLTHPSDKTADIAVLPWDYSPDMDVRLITPDVMLSSRQAVEEAGIGIGDEVFLAGVFANAYGKARNTPIVRKGNLAMLPQDKISTANMGEVDAFLIEAHSFGGISGSPVFVRETVQLGAERVLKKPDETRKWTALQGAGAFYLLGLAHGHWEIEEKDINAISMRPPSREELGINLGIALVVPASKILETLNHPRLIEDREIARQRLMGNRVEGCPGGET